AAPADDRGLGPWRRADAGVVAGARPRVLLRDLDAHGTLLVGDAVLAGVRDDHGPLPRAAHRGPHPRDAHGRARLDDLLPARRVAHLTAWLATGARRTRRDPRRHHDPPARARPAPRAGTCRAPRAQPGAP